MRAPSRQGRRYASCRSENGRITKSVRATISIQIKFNVCDNRAAANDYPSPNGVIGGSAFIALLSAVLW